MLLNHPYLNIAPIYLSLSASLLFHLNNYFQKSNRYPPSVPQGTSHGYLPTPKKILINRNFIFKLNSLMSTKKPPPS